jgi:hypothetical protein
MAFDTKCHDLATAFLSDEPKLDTPQNRNFLAQVIQTAIEDWINYNPPSYPADPLNEDTMHGLDMRRK